MYPAHVARLDGLVIPDYESTVEIILIIIYLTRRNDDRYVLRLLLHYGKYLFCDRETILMSV